MKKMIDVIMNPVRQRIAQYLIVNQTGTVNEIAQELPDIPRPSLYRHMKLLVAAELVQVVEEKAIRGTVEKTYSLVHPPADQYTNKDIGLLIHYSLLSLLAGFARYFQQEDVDPVKDMLSLSTSTLLLSDQEFVDMLGKIGQIYHEALQNKPQPDRKPRSITFISAPPNH